MNTKHFNRFSWAFAVIVIAVLASCAGGSKSKKQSLADEKFGKLEFEIPASLKDKPEIVDYINGMAKLSDEYALMVDRVMEDAKEFKGKKEEELDMIDKLKLTKIASEVGFKSIEILGRWGEYAEKRVSMEKELTEDEARALESVFKRFEERMKQVEARHSDIFKDKTEQ